MPLQNTALDAATLQAIYQRLGIVTGSAISQKISDALALSGTDVTALQDRMNTIESILDADTSTPEFDVAQNIVTQLTNLQNQITNAKDPSVVDSLAYKIAGLTGIYAYMYDSAGTAASSLLEAVKLVAKNAKDGIASVESSIADFATRISTVEGSLSTVQTDVANAQADIADTQTKIADLQTRVSDNEAAILNLSTTSTDGLNRTASLETAVDSMNGAFAAADDLVAAFCTGINSGLTGTTDASCTIGSGSSGL